MRTQPLRVTDATFSSEVLGADNPVLVDFWADWCGPCHTVAPILETLAAEFADQVTIAKVEVDENPVTANRFAIRSIPTLILFRDGTEQERMIGAKPEHVLRELLKRYSGAGEPVRDA